MDGELTRYLGQRGRHRWPRAGTRPTGSSSAGTSSPARRSQLAIFGINGPLSTPPTNFIYVRERPARVLPGTTRRRSRSRRPRSTSTVVRKDPALDAIVGPNPKIWKLAEGFAVHRRPGLGAGGERACSSPTPTATSSTSTRPRTRALEVFRQPSGYSGADIAEYGQPGSNGLTLDRAGPPDDRPARQPPRDPPRERRQGDGPRRPLRRASASTAPTTSCTAPTARSTSPIRPFGLPKFFDDPRKELTFSGVYAVTPEREAAAPDLDELTGPERHRLLARREVPLRRRLGREEEGRHALSGPPGRRRRRRATLFFDMTSAPGEDAIDGIKVDEKGNLYVSGPGGLWILSPEGRHLGTIVGAEAPPQLRLGRRGRQDALPLRPVGPLQDAARDPGHPSLGPARPRGPQGRAPRRAAAARCDARTGRRRRGLGGGAGLGSDAEGPPLFRRPLERDPPLEGG